MVEDTSSTRGLAMANRLARPLVSAVMLLAAVIATLGAILGDPWVWIERALVGAVCRFTGSCRP